MDLVGYFASLLMGVTLGLMGGGGSILTVPILVYLFGVLPEKATGYSLFIVGTTAALGSFSYVKKGDVHFSTGLSFAIPSVVGVFISRSFLVPGLPAVIQIFNGTSLTKGVLIMVVFASLMVAASVSMIRGRRGGDSGGSKPVRLGSRSAVMGGLGLAVGLIAGFVGAGGGFLIVPALVVIAGLRMKVAVGTSLMIIAIQSLIGFLGDLRADPNIEWSLILVTALIASGGIFLGSSLAHKVSEAKLKKAFGWFVLFMGAVILFDQFRRF